MENGQLSGIVDSEEIAPLTPSSPSRTPCRAGYIVGKTEYEANEPVTVEGLTREGRDALERMRNKQVQSGLALNKRTFMLFRLPEDSTPGVSSMPIGTAFGVLRPGLVLTADHVVREVNARSLLVLCTHYRRVECFIDSVESHPEADVAALFLGRMPNPKPLEHFSIGLPAEVYPGYNDFPLAEDVLAYGFPMVGVEKPINPRMMKGHIQSKYEHASSDGRYRYSAYELSLPAFPGLSGAPVFSDWNNRQAAIGIVTDRISYFTEQGGHETKAYLTLAAALHPLADWIESL